MKEKWYVATGKESTDLQSNTTKVMFGDGSIHRGGTIWAWPCEYYRIRQRKLEMITHHDDIVAYTLGEPAC